VIVDVPLNLNILYNFSKQTSTVVNNKYNKITSTAVTSKLIHFPPFLTFRNFHFLGYISEITKPISEIDTIILVSVVIHLAVATIITSLRLLHLNQFVTSVTLQMV